MAVSKEASVTLEELLLAVGGVRPLLRLSLEEAGRLAAVSRGMRAAVAGDCVWGKAQEALEADFPHLKPPEGEKLAKVHKKLEPKAEKAEDELFFPPLGDELMKMLRDRRLPDHAWRVVVADARDDAEAYAALAPQAKVGALIRYATETKAVLRKCVIDMDWESWELDLDDIDGDDLLGFDVDILQSFCRKRYSLLVKLSYVNIAERGFHEGDGPYYVVDDALSEQAIYGYRYDWMQGSSFRDWINTYVFCKDHGGHPGSNEHIEHLNAPVLRAEDLLGARLNGALRLLPLDLPADWRTACPHRSGDELIGAMAEADDMDWDVVYEHAEDGELHPDFPPFE